MRILVCGGRDYTDKEHVYSILDQCYSQNTKLEIISGMARGADTLAYEWAKERGVKCFEFPADWDRYKKAAGPLRNQQMIDEGFPDAGIAFKGTTGTADMVRRLKANCIPVLDLRKHPPKPPSPRVIRHGISQPRREHDNNVSSPRD